MTHSVLAKIRAIRARSAAPAPATPAPAAVKRSRKGLTQAALAAAISAVCDQMADCTARQTLQALYALSDDTASGDIVRLDSPSPVCIAELDEALAEAQKFDLPATTLAPLKQVRALLAQAEAQKSKEPAQYATVAQMKARDVALFDAFAWALGAMAVEFNRSQPNKSHVLDLLGRSASTPERKKLFNGICEFREADVPHRTQEDFLRYQARGHY